MCRPRPRTGDAVRTGHQRVMAALLHGGAGAVITGAEACRRHGLANVEQDHEIHLLVPHRRKVHDGAFVVVERTIRMPEPLVRGGVPLAPVSRAVLDASRRMNGMDPCRALLTEAVQRRMTSVEQLATDLARGSNRGSAIPRRVLVELGDGAHSVAEIDGGRLWRRAGLPPAQWNGKVYRPTGEFIASPDAWSDEVAMAWEIDSVAHHAGLAGFGRTVRRNARYAEMGVTCVQTLPSRLRTEPDAVIRELRNAFAAAARRPRPPVVFRPAQGDDVR